MYQILAWNAQNRFGFWGSAPDPAGGAYDAPSDARSFFPSAIAASRLQRWQSDLLSHVLIGTPASRSQFLPFRLPLLNSWIWPRTWGLGVDELGIFLYSLFPPNLCFRAFCYFMNPASNKYFIQKYKINISKKCTPFWHKMLKIASASGALPHIPLGELTVLPQTL